MSPKAPTALYPPNHPMIFQDIKAPIEKSPGFVSTPSLSSFATLSLNTLLATENDSKNHTPNSQLASPASSHGNAIPFALI